MVQGRQLLKKTETIIEVHVIYNFNKQLNVHKKTIVTQQRIIVLCFSFHKLK